MTITYRMGPKRRIGPIIQALNALYPQVKTELDFRTPYELVVATILSAQCTDKRVNQVTPALFARYPTPKSMATADPHEVMELVHSTGFYRNKSKNIIGMAQKLVSEYGGEVPRTMEELLVLPGVARKTANCVLNNCFSLSEGIVVDTHVARLAIRLGLTRAKKSNAVKIEQDLMAVVPTTEWIGISHRLIYHGRRVCDSRKPNCGTCSLFPLCPHGNRLKREEG